MKPFYPHISVLKRYSNYIIIPAFAFLIFSCQGNGKTNEPAGTNADSGKNDTHAMASTAGSTQVSVTKDPIPITSDYIAPQMVLVKGGHFRMGDDTRTDEKEEKPEHTVNLSSFMMGKYEVTVAEFRKFMNTHTYVTDAEKAGFSFVFDGKELIYEKKGVTWEYDVLGNKRVNQEDHPVIHVSRNDAIAYCNWLSRQTGKVYRLPTEAEWEYAAKGGPRHDKYEYSGGNDIEQVAWYAWNSDFLTHPVGKKKPNGLGIYDMTGNVWEWCSDWFGPYSAAEQTNPTGPATGDQGVLRGGAWRFFVVRLRVTVRRDCYPSFNGSGPGFRLASSSL